MNRSRVILGTVICMVLVQVIVCMVLSKTGYLRIWIAGSNPRFEQAGAGKTAQEEPKPTPRLKCDALTATGQVQDQDQPQTPVACPNGATDGKYQDARNWWREPGQCRKIVVKTTGQLKLIGRGDIVSEDGKLVPFEPYQRISKAQVTLIYDGAACLAVTGESSVEIDNLGSIEVTGSAEIAVTESGALTVRGDYYYAGEVVVRNFPLVEVAQNVRLYADKCGQVMTDYNTHGTKVYASRCQQVTSIHSGGSDAPKLYAYRCNLVQVGVGTAFVQQCKKVEKKGDKDVVVFDANEPNATGTVEEARAWFNKNTPTHSIVVTGGAGVSVTVSGTGVASEAPAKPEEQWTSTTKLDGYSSLPTFTRASRHELTMNGESHIRFKGVGQILIDGATAIDVKGEVSFSVSEDGVITDLYDNKEGRSEIKVKNCPNLIVGHFGYVTKVYASDCRLVTLKEGKAYLFANNCREAVVSDGKLFAYRCNLVRASGGIVEVENCTEVPLSSKSVKVIRRD